jgi:hypothetical protein
VSLPATNARSGSHDEEFKRERPGEQNPDVVHTPSLSAKARRKNM